MKKHGNDLVCKALAAIGQGRLIALWDNLFGQLGQPSPRFYSLEGISQMYVVFCALFVCAF